MRMLSIRSEYSGETPWAWKSIGGEELAWLGFGSSSPVELVRLVPPELVG